MSNRAEYFREYKRKRRLDPEYRARENARNLATLNANPKRVAQKRAHDRARWKSDPAYRKQRNRSRVECSQRHLHENPQGTRSKRNVWHKAFFARHYGDSNFKEHRDLYRVKAYYSTDDPVLVEALALMRAAKRKLHQDRGKA